MSLLRALLAVLVVGVATAASTPPAGEGGLPPGWLPVAKLDAATGWGDVRKIDDRIQLYLPDGVPAVRGVFVCYVFHSGDPRELARLWRFALVTVPTQFEYDLGYYDKRNPRGVAGLPKGDMSVLLRYLEAAARETSRPELAVAPIVGWLGQNGSVMCADLFKRAPDRVIAWTDAWYGAWSKHPEMIARVPVASAWELKEGERAGERAKAGNVAGKPTPAPDLRCFATTYGFGHGIFSKWNFFMAFLDRCIALRLPETMPPPGKPVPLRPAVREKGWVGDYNEISEAVAMAPFAEAKGMVAPIWLPDAYGAWMWRAYHSAKPDLRITGPVVAYRKGGGSNCGLGYGALRAGPQRVSAEVPAGYTSVEFRSGDRVLGSVTAAPWHVDAQLDRGLHALIAVGTGAGGKLTVSQPALVVVE